MVRTPHQISKILLFVAAVTGFVLPHPSVLAQSSNFYFSRPDDGGFEEIQMLTGDLQTIEVNNLKRLSINDPSVADISNAEENEILISALQAGQTTLFVWDDLGKRSIIIRVIDEDLTLLKQRIENLFEKMNIEDVKIERNEYEGRVVLSGELLPEDKTNMEKIIEPFGGRIINLVTEEVVEDLIQIDMQITELSTTLAQTLGVDWNNVLDGGEGLVLGYEEIPPTQTGDFEDLFKIGNFQRTTKLLATIDALIVEGKARILSKPRLVVTNGKEATFLVGGEIPIRTTVLNATGSNFVENVTFKEYGVNMGITPTINKEGKIDILLNVEISDIDAANKVGEDVAFITRSAQTQLMLDNGQTIVLAGMISKRETENVKRIPILSKIPVIGGLFRSSDVPKSDTEIVISLTPTIMKGSKKDKERVEAKADVEPKSRKKAKKAKAAKAKKSEPRITKNTMNSTVSVPGNISPYVREIQQRISQAIAYPLEAKENGWTGTVRITMTILNDGTLKTVDLKESSGYNVFDQDALNTAQILAPYAPFPQELGLEELIVTVPIVYSHESFLQSARNN